MLRRHRFLAGFTLIELVVVMAIVGLLLGIAAPRYFRSLEKSRETVLQQNLSLTREALDRYYGDHGEYPSSLETLVSDRYLRRLPLDPITRRSDTWTTVSSGDPEKGGISDIRSGAAGKARDGTPYSAW